MGNAPPPYTRNIHEDRSEALELIGRAHDAERAGQYKGAYEMHTQAANLLFQTIEYGVLRGGWISCVFGHRRRGWKY